MKSLIVVACIAVIAAVGYFFVQEYRDAQQQAELIERMRFRARCDDVVQRFALKPMNKADETLLTNCFFQGVRTPEDVRAELDRLKKRNPN